LTIVHRFSYDKVTQTTSITKSSKWSVLTGRAGTNKAGQKLDQLYISQVSSTWAVFCSILRVPFHKVGATVKSAEHIGGKTDETDSFPLQNRLNLSRSPSAT